MNSESTDVQTNPTRTLPTSFEKVVQQLNLAPEDYAKSLVLRDWVSRNKNEKYVPPDLLKAFGFEVSADIWAKQARFQRARWCC